MKNENVFTDLFHLDITGKVEKKQGLSYLSWSWAWAEVKKRYPDAKYKIERFGENKKPYLFDSDLGYMVFTTVTINDLTHEMWLPVMNGANKAMKNVSYEYQVIKWTKGKRDGYETRTVEPATMFDINTTIMRCLVKNLAMHGIGLHLYAGEDLPEAPPVSKVSQTQISALRAVIKKIAELTNQRPAFAENRLLEVNKMPTDIEQLNVDQYGEFLHYLKQLKEKYESDAKESKSKEKPESKPDAKPKADAPEAEPEQTTILKGNTITPNE